MKLDSDDSDDSCGAFLLTVRGERLLGLLSEVEKELDEFYATSLSTELIDRSRSSPTRPSFGSERGRVPIEIRRAASY